MKGCYREVKKREREKRENERETFICCFISQVAPMAMTMPGWSQEPGLDLDLRVLHVLKHLGHLPLHPQTHVKETGLETEEPGFTPTIRWTLTSTSPIQMILFLTFIIYLTYLLSNLISTSSVENIKDDIQILLTITQKAECLCLPVRLWGWVCCLHFS